MTVAKEEGASLDPAGRASEPAWKPAGRPAVPGDEWARAEDDGSKIQEWGISEIYKTDLQLDLLNISQTNEARELWLGSK